MHNYQKKEKKTTHSQAHYDKSIKEMNIYVLFIEIGKIAIKIKKIDDSNQAAKEILFKALQNSGLGKDFRKRLQVA